MFIAMASIHSGWRCNSYSFGYPARPIPLYNGNYWLATVPRVRLRLHERSWNRQLASISDLLEIEFL